ncbi:unnamed protein product [Fraxinus pennsylvanica]|uniref:Non-haem dioxygenase N-terminal domain-containing protein n=1 Tax=Fraxinus pennsylvanica TaxID=56036 RepID=A0AAD2DRW5_9LAMI|nr:unnamed protein product [Fraxinus pennsylvanica]
MVVTSNGKYDWAKEVKEFDETKAGVKGLVDAGVAKIPQFFVHPPESLATPGKTAKNVQLELPTIDFEGVETGGARRKEVVDQIRKAARMWGFFRIVNHCIPLHIMDAMLEAVKRFHEQPVEEKKPLYTADSRQRIISNDKSVSVEHRVLAQSVGPRISVACFFYPSLRAGAKPFAPIKEILSDENPTIYREFLFKEYCEYYKTKGQDVSSALPRYRIEGIIP